MSGKRKDFAISVMCRDRVGLIYEISKAISELEGNIADVRQSVLSGYFTMILLASFPEDVDQRAVERKFAEVDSRSDTVIDVAVEEVDHKLLMDLNGMPENTYVLTATGPDRIGFVATVASFCAAQDINILDSSTTTSEKNYIMILLVDLSRCGDIGEVRKELQGFAEENNLNVVLQHRDIFQAVNEINLPSLY
jgi:predicted amino acid-binding ACT domain protein